MQVKIEKVNFEFICASTDGVKRLAIRLSHEESFAFFF